MTEVAYLPDLLANTECVGSSACYVQTVESGDCTENDGDCEGTWSACDSSDSSTCTRDYGEWVGRNNLKRTNPNSKHHLKARFGSRDDNTPTRLDRRVSHAGTVSLSANPKYKGIALCG